MAARKRWGAGKDADAPTEVFNMGFTSSLASRWYSDMEHQHPP